MASCRGLWSALVVIWLGVGPLRAGVVTDGTLGPSQALAGPDYAVTAELGAIRGENLFHSFAQFEVGTGESAHFLGPDSIRRIISRVTGEGAFINGLVSSEIVGADLFMLSPGGIFVGPSGRFELSGALYLSTAETLSFTDGGVFDATSPGQSILSAAPPSSFGFISPARGRLHCNPAGRCWIRVVR